MQRLVFFVLLLFNSQYIFSNTFDSIKGYWHGFGLILEIKECDDTFCAEIDHIFVSKEKNPLDYFPFISIGQRFFVSKDILQTFTRYGILIL